jgi:DNA topoisomerase-1
VGGGRGYSYAMRLTTSDPTRPGLTRRACGRGFRYFDADGTAVQDRKTLARVKALAIPPAWTDVWICPRPTGHVQAMGTDNAGRRQYLYHEEFRRRQELAKHEHVLEVAEQLPILRKAVAERLSGRGLTRDRVLACAIRLLDVGFFRVGSESYAQENGSYGLTTVLRGHVRRSAGVVAFDFPAKSGKRFVSAVGDPAACAVVMELRRRKGAGDRLLAYWDRGERRWYDVHSGDLNACLREWSGTDVSAKDFRTWHATVLAAVALAVSERVAGARAAERKRAESRAVREVAAYLGNTPAVCRSSYINPAVFELFDRGVTISGALGGLGEMSEVGEGVVPFGMPATQGRVEQAVLRMLDGESGAGDA